MATESKFKKKRLFKVSRELNVSVDTIVDDLKTAGFTKAMTGSGLNAAITDEEAYAFLLETYAEDRATAERVKKKRAQLAEEEGEGVDVDGEVIAVETPEPEEAEETQEIVEIVEIVDEDDDAASIPEEDDVAVDVEPEVAVPTAEVEAVEVEAVEVEPEGDVAEVIEAAVETDLTPTDVEAETVEVRRHG